MGRLLALVVLCSALAGCELIADFDRSKIPVEERPAPDGGADAAAPRLDAGPDEQDAGDDDAG